MSSNTRRQGQSRGQGQKIAALAKTHHVPASWVRLIAFGRLDDPAFVAAIRDAAKVPALWEVVSPAAQDALLLPTAKVEALGGTLDDLLGMLLDCIETLAHPRNRNFASTHTPLQCVVESLDDQLEMRLHAHAERGRRQLASTAKAASVKAQRARDASRAIAWRGEVEQRRAGTSKEAVYARIERRERLQSGTVKKAVLRLQRATR